MAKLVEEYGGPDADSEAADCGKFLRLFMFSRDSD